MKLFRYDGGPAGFKAGIATVDAGGGTPAVTSEALGPSSINVFDLQLEAKP
ncbi:MAG: hypothetical protein ACHREM_19650 [Polyangiales bacterium]